MDPGGPVDRPDPERLRPLRLVDSVGAGRDAATARVLGRAQEAGVARPDIDQRELMQLVGGMCMARGATVDQNLGLLTFILDGIRAR